MHEDFWKNGDDGQPLCCGSCDQCVGEPWETQNPDREEFIGQMIDTVENFLQQNADYFRYLDWYTIENNPDKDDVILFGRRFELLYREFSDLLDRWEIKT